LLHGLDQVPLSRIGKECCRGCSRCLPPALQAAVVEMAGWYFVARRIRDYLLRQIMHAALKTKPKPKPKPNAQSRATG
jgi:hypothetical protein